MPVPDFQSLMLPLLRLSARGECRISDAVEKLAEEFSLSQEERSQLLPSGRQTRFSNRVNWAKSYLGKAGLIELTRRAHFYISERGKAVLANPPERIDIQFLEQFRDFQDFREAKSNREEQFVEATADSEALLTPDEVIRRAHEELEASLADDLLLKVRGSSPVFFESLVVRLLMAMGYGGSVQDLGKALVGGSGDGGIDGIIDQDPLGLDQIYVQAKCYAEGNNIGAGAIRDFFGALDMKKAAKGIFFTTSSFSSSATDTARMLGKRIVLIDGRQLARLMLKHDVGCRPIESLTIRQIDEDFFEA